MRQADWILVAAGAVLIVASLIAVIGFHPAARDRACVCTAPAQPRFETCRPTGGRKDTRLAQLTGEL